MKRVSQRFLIILALLSPLAPKANVPDSLSLYKETLDMYYYVRENPDSVMKRAWRLLSD